MAFVLQRDSDVDRPKIDPPSALPEDDRLAPVIGVYNAVCICLVFWSVVGLVVWLAAYLLF